MDAARELFREYQNWLNVDLCFQDFENELKELPGAYAQPKGRLYLVREKATEQWVGCVALRPQDDGMCEMKRLYVREPWRGTGLGRHLASVSVSEAEKAGYACICLDTLGFLTEAITLYKSLGFEEIEAYYDNPLDDVVYLQKNLIR